MWQFCLFVFIFWPFLLSFLLDFFFNSGFSGIVFLKETWTMPKAHCNQMVANMIHIYIEMYHIQLRKFSFNLSILAKCLKINLISYVWQRYGNISASVEGLTRNWYFGNLSSLSKQICIHKYRLFMYFHLKFV